MQTSPISQIEDRLVWYDSKAAKARAYFLVAKGVELATAAAIPIVALSGGPALVTAGLGALIAVVAGLEQLVRFQETWINYRQTAETLRNELFLYHSGAGPYENLAADVSPEKLVANRSASLFAQENGRWQALAQQASIPGHRGDGPHP